MSIVTVARIQHRRGVRTDLPASLNEGELGWCLDTRELFIGNSLAEGGNTQVLTTSTDLASVINYTFKSDTSVESQTGPTMNQPVVRPLQLQIDDQWVNVKAYGAVGNGIADDTDAINRAIYDLYTKILSYSENTSQTRKAIWFPSGVYRVSNAVLLYPYVKLVGENANNTTILLTNGTNPENVLMRTVDSLGQQGANIGNNDAVPPTQITVTNLSLRLAVGDVAVLIQRATDVLFDNCQIYGYWSTGAAPLHYGIRAETLSGVLPTENIKFVNCLISQVVQGYYTTDEVSYVTFEGCAFDSMFKGIYLTNTLANNGPLYTRVVNTRFQDIEDYGIQVESPNPGITSMGNWFINVGITSGVEPILWDASSTLCSSVGDLFDLGIVLTLVQDLGTNNMILDAQQSNFSVITAGTLSMSVTALNATFFPVLVDALGGTPAPVGSTLLNFNPATGQLGVNNAAPAYTLDVTGDSYVSDALISNGRIRLVRGDAGPVVTVVTNDDIILVDTSGGPITVDLPAVPTQGRTYTIKDDTGNSTLNNITVVPNAGNIDGSPNLLINSNYGYARLVYSGTEWKVV